MAQYHFSDFGGAVGPALYEKRRPGNAAYDERARPVRHELVRTPLGARLRARVTRRLIERGYLTLHPAPNATPSSYTGS